MDAKIDGSLIRLYRIRRGRSQEWLANQVGVDQSQIHRWEQGKIPKRWKEYAAVCKALEIEQIDLLYREAKVQYNWLLVSYEEALIGVDSLAIARLSAQTLNWQRFFSVGKFGDDELTDDEVEHSNEIEREIAEMFRGKN